VSGNDHGRVTPTPLRGRLVFAAALAGTLGLAASPDAPLPRPMRDHTIIAVAPMGATSPTAVSLITPALRSAFGGQVVLAPSLPLPSPAYDPVREQTNSTALLDVLARAKRPEWERLLGIAEVDLFVPELNFVFGEGDAERGVGVFSLHRLRPGPSGREDVLARRAATEAVHELGHSFGLGHCRDPRCVMWFSNSLAETDRKGTAFCAVHAAELSRRRAQ